MPVVATTSVLSETDTHGRALKMEHAEFAGWLMVII